MCWVNVHAFVLNSLDLDQAQCFVGPGLGPNCLQRLSALQMVWTQIRTDSPDLHPSRLTLSVPEINF